ncbi:MAG: chaperone modulator CbpM [Gammaproteobacteria bacterium]
MTKNNLVIVSIEEYPELTLEEICHACHVPADFIQDIIDFGIIEPHGASIASWRFDAEHLRRVRTVVHLHHDLEVNLAGAALVLDLLDELQRMRARLAVFEKRS